MSRGEQQRQREKKKLPVEQGAQFKTRSQDPEIRT